MSNQVPRRFLMLCAAFLCAAAQVRSIEADPWVSAGRKSDPTAKTISEIRASERRRIPLDVQLKTARRYAAGGPVDVTLIITNLFDAPLLMNSRMLVNHPLLQGEVSFRILGPDGKRIEIERLITPLSTKDDDFVLLERGQSFERSVDLADLYGITKKGVYKIQASYHNEIDNVSGAQHAWKGIVWSESAELRLD